jgi:hypothetical protein
MIVCLRWRQVGRNVILIIFLREKPHKQIITFNGEGGVYFDGHNKHITTLFTQTAELVNVTASYTCRTHCALNGLGTKCLRHKLATSHPTASTKLSCKIKYYNNERILYCD